MPYMDPRGYEDLFMNPSVKWNVCGFECLHQGELRLFWSWVESKTVVFHSTCQVFCNVTFLGCESLRVKGWTSDLQRFRGESSWGHSLNHLVKRQND